MSDGMYLEMIYTDSKLSVNYAYYMVHCLISTFISFMFVFCYVISFCQQRLINKLANIVQHAMETTKYNMKITQ